MIELHEGQWSAVRVSGDDRLAFLQGQLTQDVANGGSQWTMVLQPDGAVLVAAVLRPDLEWIDLVVPKESVEALRARLQRFLLRVKVVLDVIDGVPAPLTTSELVTSGWPSSAEWDLGLPPHSFGREIVDATISFQKGCFTGQELVGRADARGASMPWRYLRGCGGDLQQIDGALRAVGPEGPQGVTSWADIDGRLFWRGFAHRTLEAERVIDELGGELQFLA